MPLGDRGDRVLIGSRSLTPVHLLGGGGKGTNVAHGWRYPHSLGVVCTPPWRGGTPTKDLQTAPSPSSEVTQGPVTEITPCTSARPLPC